MSWGLVAIGVSAVGTIASASSANNASKDSTRAATEASDANIALARETRDKNEALYAPDMASGDRAQSYLDALTYGSSGGYDGPGGSYASDPEAAAFLDLVEGRYASPTPGQQQLLDDYQASGETDPLAFHSRIRYGEGGGALTREDVMGQIEQQPLYQWNEEDYGVRNDLVDQAYTDETGVYTDARERGYELAGTRRADLTGIATNRYDTTRGYLEEDLATRTGYTDKAIADRSALNDIENQKAQDSHAGMLWVTGQAGKFARAIAEATNENNLAYSDTVRAYRNEDDYPYSTGRITNENTYAGDLEGYGADYYDDIGGADASYYDNLTGATKTRSAGYSSNYDTRASGRNSAYGSYVDDLDSRVSTGQNAKGQIANSNSDYASTVSNANTSKAQAYSDSANQRAAITGQAYADASSLAGNVYGAYTYGNTKKKKATGNTSSGVTANYYNTDYTYGY